MLSVNFGKQLAHNCCILDLVDIIQDVFMFSCLVFWQMVFNVVYLMDFKILDECIGFAMVLA